MKITFSKYHGTGNDFIMIDNRTGQFNDKTLNTNTIAALCHRHTGIGADGLILLNNHPQFPFAMRYYNADGRESTMCGNGGRCIVAFARQTGAILPHEKQVQFSAIDGLHQAVITGDVPPVVSLKMRDITTIKNCINGFWLDSGSPHYVELVDDLKKIDIMRQGATRRYNPQLGRGGSNVNFVKIADDNKIEVRTYERGVEAETLSCGTGVVASVIAVNHTKNHDFTEYKIKTEGGLLKVSFTKQEGLFTDIVLQGPATHVFDGVVVVTSIF